MTRKQLITSLEYLEATVGCFFDEYGVSKKKLRKDIVRFIVEHREEYHLLNSEQEDKRSVATKMPIEPNPDPQNAQKEPVIDWEGLEKDATKEIGDKTNCWILIDWLKTYITKYTEDSNSEHWKWTTEKPNFTEECLLLIAKRYRDDKEFEYDLFEIRQMDGFDEDGNPSGYLGIICPDGEEWGDLGDLSAQLYMTMPLLNKDQNVQASVATDDAQRTEPRQTNKITSPTT